MSRKVNVGAAAATLFGNRHVDATATVQMVAAAAVSAATTTGLRCTHTAATMSLRTKAGVKTVPAGLLPSVPDDWPSLCGHPDRFRAFATAASALRVRIPESSTAKLQGAVRRFKEMLFWWGIPETAVTPLVVTAFIVARCCPPVDAELPKEMATPVLPTTAAGDIDAIRRAARLKVLGAERWTAAVDDDGVSQLLRAVGARVKRLTTVKKPLLFRQVREAWDKAEADGSAVAVRDGFALVVAFVFALRVSELVGLREEDLDLVDVCDENDALRITIRQSKTRQSLFGLHEPWTSTSAHPLLMRAFGVFEKAGCLFRGEPLLCRLSGSTRDPLSRDWFAHVMKAAAPECVPHSARVGCATELYAAGATIEEIMVAGRWTSPAALLYVIGTLDAQVRTTALLGAANLRAGAAGLRSGASAGPADKTADGFDEKPAAELIRAWLPVIARAVAKEAAEFDDGGIAAAA